MISIEDQFKYHPPTTEERKQKHNKINEAALSFALVVGEVISPTDPMYQGILNAIQQARMLSNQAITYQDLSK